MIIVPSKPKFLESSVPFSSSQCYGAQVETLKGEAFGKIVDVRIDMKYGRISALMTDQGKVIEGKDFFIFYATKDKVIVEPLSPQAVGNIRRIRRKGIPSLG